MKHTKGRFSIRKHPFIITFIIMAVIAVVVAVGYIDVNHRFPEPEEEIVEKDEWEKLFRFPYVKRPDRHEYTIQSDPDPGTGRGTEGILLYDYFME